MPSRSIAQSQFAHTRWSLVARLKDDGDGDGDAGRRNLRELCLHNWYPVYSYLRRCGHAPESAQELTRAFFDQVLRAGPARAADSRFGRFHQFVLSELHRFLSMDRPPKGTSALQSPLSVAEMEARQRSEGGFAGSPEQALRRGFALEILASALDRLRAEASEAGRSALFEALERFLTTDPQPGELEVVAGQFQLRALFVVMAIKRLRQRFRELVDGALGDVVLNAEELEVERRALQEALTGEPT